MLFRWLVLIAALCLPSVAAHAQIGLYGKFDLNHLNDNSGSPSEWLRGGGLGIYDDFLPLGPVHVGLDVRADAQTGSLHNYRSLLGGVRVAVKPPLVGLRPYVQASVGVGGPKRTFVVPGGFPGTYERKLLYEFLGGVDLTVLPHVDWRLVEVGFGRQSGVDGYPTAPASSLVLLSTGLVLRLP